MRSREAFNEFNVGFRELIRAKVLRFYPSKLRNFERDRFAINDRAVEEMKVNGLRGIVMNRRVVLVMNLCMHT